MENTKTEQYIKRKLNQEYFSYFINKFNAIPFEVCDYE